MKSFDRKAMPKRRTKNSRSNTAPPPAKLVTTSDDRELLPLYDYVRNGLYCEVESWVRNGNPVYNPESKKYPVIVYAARSGFYSMLKEFLRLDWRSCPKGLNKALEYSVRLGNVYATELLLNSGADPEFVCWEDVFYTRIPAMIMLFFNAKKSIRTLHRGLDSLEKNTAATVKNIYKSTQDIEASLFLAAKEALRRWHWEGCGHKVRDPNRTIAHNDKILGLLYWIGLDFEKRFPDDDQASSILEIAEDCGIDLKYRKKRKLKNETESGIFG